MTHIFTTRFHVRQYELNAQNDLPNAAFLRLFQEAATRATQEAGFAPDWFTTRHAVWLVHHMTLERVCPVTYPTAITITTWLSDVQKVRTHREYLARDAATSQVVARGRASWVYINYETRMPLRIPPELITQFQPNGVRAITRIVPRALALTEKRSCAITVSRRAQRYEADGMHHINNAVYVDWLEDVLADALTTQGAPRWRVYRHEIEYVRSAIPGDAVTVSAQLIGAGHCAMAWQLEIARGDELLIRDHATTLWLDDAGRPAPKANSRAIKM